MERCHGLVGPYCPGLKPPPGVIPQLEHPPSQQDYNLFCQTVCLAVATACVATRLFTKFYLTRNHGWEDYTCFIAWCGLVVYSSLQLSPTYTRNAGVHQWNVMQKDLVAWAKLANVIEIIYNPIIFFTKLSILLLFLRIFVPGAKNKTYYLIHLLIWLNLLFYIANVPIEIWPCIPRRKIWAPQTPGHCLDNEQVFVAGGSVNMVSDFAILILPIVSVSRLQMSWRKKVGVSAIFAAGFFVCIASIMHLVTSIKAATDSDKTYYIFPVALWTTAEIASGIVCGCLVTMPHFFRHMAPKIASSFTFLSRSSHLSGSGSSSAPRASSSRQRADSNQFAGSPLGPKKRRTQWDAIYNGGETDRYTQLDETEGWIGSRTDIEAGKGGDVHGNGDAIVQTIRLEQYPTRMPTLEFPRN